jgi:hypothetical protein
LILYFLLFEEKEKKKERKGRNGQWAFFPQDRHALLTVSHWDFPGCYLQLKSVLRVNP